MNNRWSPTTISRDFEIIRQALSLLSEMVVMPSGLDANAALNRIEARVTETSGEGINADV